MVTDDDALIKLMLDAADVELAVNGGNRSNQMRAALAVYREYASDSIHSLPSPIGCGGQVCVALTEKRKS